MVDRDMYHDIDWEQVFFASNHEGIAICFFPEIQVALQWLPATLGQEA